MSSKAETEKTVLTCSDLQPPNGLNPVCVEIKPHSLNCIVGPCDSGKTAYLRTLGGVDKPLHGKLNILDQSFWDLQKPEQLLLRQRACYVLPNVALLSSYSVIRNVTLPALYHQLDTAEAIEKRAYSLLNWLGFNSDPMQLPGFLPAFQRRLIAISRCLMLQPEILFVDEAFAFLDPLGMEKMTQRYLDMRRELDITLILATHNLDFASKHADSIIFMHPDGARTYSSWQQALDDPDAYIKTYIQASMRHSYGGVIH